MQLLEFVCDLAVGVILAACRNQTAQPLLKLRVRGDRRPALTQEGASLEYRLRNAREGFAAGRGGQLRDRQSGRRIRGAKGAERGQRRGPFQNDAPALPFDLDPALHRASVPRLVLGLYRKLRALAARAGIHAVEHRGQKLRPGRFSGLVAAADHVQPRLQVELLAIQPSKGRLHGFQLHSARTSRPSRRSRPSFAASATVRRSSSSAFS